MATTTETKTDKNDKNDKGATAAGASKPRQRKRQSVKSMMAAPWKPENEGDCLEGIYHGVETVKGKGKRGDFKSYHIEKPDGERVRVASAMLNTKMNQIPKGSYVWLTYKGMFETSNGESPDYDVDVEDGTELIDPLQGDGSVTEARV